ncbi:PAS domain-containing sensor histidine kinase [Persicobacter sp. CCB-QB2]|uniref:sensor histidine kinase n=1 Tax=Persicobacter sp. CCB-QB2 TaxID=1561025 RepID=UPI0006A98FB9|nr:ATP-binding protein [Persicobacter sp. CCB-QB2]
MEYNSLKKEILLRLIALTVSVFALAFLILSDDRSAFSIIVVLLLVAGQVFLLMKMMDTIHNALSKFFQLKENGNTPFRFPQYNDQSYLSGLYRELNGMLNEFRLEPEEGREKYNYLKNIVQHAGVGLITFDSRGKVEIFNTEAKNLLGIESLDHISALTEVHPELRQQIKNLKTGGRGLIKIQNGDEEVNLSLFAVELHLNKENFKLISFQNIQSELDQNEMEAWQKLVRVLTHEIMNSITPITSLASTIEGDIIHNLDRCEEEKEFCDFPKADLEDLQMAVRTIQKRGEGLIHFVTDFRSLTKIPKPERRVVAARSLFDEVVRLMAYETQPKNIDVKIDVIPDDLAIFVDPQQLQQVLINLMQNACQAIKKKEGGLIELIALRGGKADQTLLIIRDNGTGIEADALAKIFIPFFTTKKNGSGIGLALSRQIIRQHHGNITAKSTEGVGSEFTIRIN